MEEKKGEDILLLDIQELAAFTDYFVICSGTSDRMLDSLADAAVAKVKGQFDFKGRVEGRPADGWIVVDFGSVVLHLLSPDLREYYQLEELWSAGKIIVRLQ